MPTPNLRHLHHAHSGSAYLTGDFIFFTTGLLIALLLLVLTLRAARIPGTPLANISFALCALLWSGGGLARVWMTASFGYPSSAIAIAE